MRSVRTSTACASSSPKTSARCAFASASFFGPRAVLVEVDNGERLAALLATTSFDLVLSDVRMPGRNGIDVLRDRRALGDRTPFIIVTGSGPTAVSDEDLEPARVLGKPFAREDLFVALWSLLGDRATRRGDAARQG